MQLENEKEIDVSKVVDVEIEEIEGSTYRKESKLINRNIYGIHYFYTAVIIFGIIYSRVILPESGVIELGREFGTLTPMIVAIAVAMSQWLIPLGVVGLVLSFFIRGSKVFSVYTYAVLSLVGMSALVIPIVM